MVLLRVFAVVSLLIWLVPEDSLSQNALVFSQPSEQPCTKSSYISKLHLNQTAYPNSIHYSVPVPELTKGFTTHFWLNLDELNRNSTVLSYALNLHQLDTLVLKYVGGGTMPLWELTFNGTIVFRQSVPPLIQGQWHHLTVTWDANRDTWALYQDGKLSAEGKSQQAVDHPVPGGGTIVIGVVQRSLVKVVFGEDHTEGIVGWLTHFYLHSQPIGQHEYFQKVWTGRCSIDMPVFKDIIDWVHTPHMLVGGVVEVKASSSCGFF